MSALLLVEDEEHLAQGLIFNLQAEGYEVHHAMDGVTALAWLQAGDHKVDAVLLDVMLPGKDGFAVAQELRAAGNFVPILMLTARGRPEDILRGFNAGVDDYLTKPFELSILLARIKSLLRRMRWQTSQPETATPDTDGNAEVYISAGGSYSFAGRTIDFANLEIHALGKTARLTLMEMGLLRYLVEHPNRVIARKEILEKVWRVHEDTDTRAIDNFIVRLRRYIEQDPSRPEHLVTVRGVGYRFLPEPADE
ncbi:MAG TPA: response regulator transcription factor [Acidobacteriaceae bacterium]|jgi:DNA-binding response OmpR family regulator|nr:response regulator transcription factor [Acidobacteriaceae bacterium]